MSMQNVQTIEVAGHRMVLIEEPRYFKLLERAGEPTLELGLPPMPAKLPSGNFPAVEYARASVAREIVRTRRRLGLSQAELARRAGLATPYLCRLEKGRVNPGVGTVEKIDQVFRAVQKQAAGKQ